MYIVQVFPSAEAHELNHFMLAEDLLFHRCLWEKPRSLSMPAVGKRYWVKGRARRGDMNRDGKCWAAQLLIKP